MHDAIAGLDDSYAPRAGAGRGGGRSAPRRKGGRSAGGAAARGRRRGAFARLPRYAAIAMGATIAVGIVVNALMMQHGHHPAPLFAGAAEPPAGTPVAAAAKPSEPAPPRARIADRTADKTADADAAPIPAPAARAGAHAVARSHANEHVGDHAPRDEDAIARLIGGAAPTPAAHKTRPAAGKGAASKTASDKAATEKAAQDRAGQDRAGSEKRRRAEG